MNLFPFLLHCLMTMVDSENLPSPSLLTNLLFIQRKQLYLMWTWLMVIVWPKPGIDHNLFHNILNAVEKYQDVLACWTDILRDLLKQMNITGQQVELCIHHLS